MEFTFSISDVISLSTLMQLLLFISPIKVPSFFYFIYSFTALTRFVDLTYCQARVQDKPTVAICIVAIILSLSLMITTGVSSH